MKAIQLLGKKQLRLADVPVPEIDENEALLKVRAASICGTDVRMYLNGYKGVTEETPLVLCHEFAGDIVKVGKNVTSTKAGMKVSVAPNMGCGTCDMCVSGNTHLCRNYKAFGVTMDGGFQEYVRIPEQAIRQGNVSPLDDKISYQEAALVEPLSCIYNGQKLLPGIVDYHTVSGYLSHEAASELGIPSGIPLIAGAGDKIAGCIGAGILSTGDTIFEASSYGAVSVLAEGYTPNPARYDNDAIPAAESGKYYLHKYLPGSGITLQWFLDTFGDSDGKISDAFRSMEESVSKIPCGSEGLMAVGLLGGGARSEVWRRIMADVTGCAFLNYSGYDAALWGTAVLAGRGIGLFTDLRSASGTASQTGGPAVPDAVNHEIYEKYLAVYEQLTAHMHPVCEKLMAIEREGGR